MTLDEAIAQERAKAQEQRYYANFENNTLMHQSCVRCAEEHEQLAEWLEELKAYQQQHIALCEKHDVNTVEELDVKAINDFAKWLENKKYLMKEIQEHDFCYTHYDELKSNYVVAEYLEEQLKAGEDNV